MDYYARGTASVSSIGKIQRQENKILRMITAAPWYVKNSQIHEKLSVPGPYATEKKGYPCNHPDSRQMTLLGTA